MRSWCIILLFPSLIDGHSTIVEFPRKTVNGTVGGSVTLSHQHPGDPLCFHWSFNGSGLPEYIFGGCGNNPLGKRFKGRLHLNQMGNLKISNLRSNDSGVFQLQTKFNGTAYISRFDLMVGINTTLDHQLPGNHQYARATTVEAPVKTPNGTVAGNTTLEHQLPENHQDDSWWIYVVVAFAIFVIIAVFFWIKKMKHKRNVGNSGKVYFGDDDDDDDDEDEEGQATGNTLMLPRNENMQPCAAQLLDGLKMPFKRATAEQPASAEGGGDMFRGEQEITLHKEENQDMLPLERVKKREESAVIAIEPQWKANAQVSVSIASDQAEEMRSHLKTRPS